MILALAALFSSACALRPPSAPRARQLTITRASIGVYYSTQSQNTEAAADLLVELVNEKFGGAAGDTSFLVDECDSAEDLLAHDALLVGCPTWNTGADDERSGTEWDEWYYDDGALPSVDLAGKRVAVFGCGDSVGYSGNFCDAIDELYTVVEGRGAAVGFGHVPAAGYRHEASKALRGDAFCGCPLDQVNEGDKTEQRLRAWLDQLAAEGFFGAEAAAAAPPSGAAAEAAPPSGAAAEADVAAVVRGLLPAVVAPAPANYVLTPENLSRLLVIQHGRLQAALARVAELEAAAASPAPAAAASPAPAAAADPAPRAPGAGAVVSSDVVVPEGAASAAIAHVVVDVAGVDFVEGQCLSLLPPGLDAKTGAPHKKRRLYTVASARPAAGAASARVALCVRAVDGGVASNWLHGAAPGDAVDVAPKAVGKTMVLPDDRSGGLVLVGTSTGAATFRGFLEFLGPDLAGCGPVVILLGGSARGAIPYVDEFEKLAAELGPGRLRVELALGGGRVDDGSETDLPRRVADFTPVVAEILGAGGHLYVSGLRGMLKPCEAALSEFLDLKDLKKAKRYHAEVY